MNTRTRPCVRHHASKFFVGMFALCVTVVGLAPPAAVAADPVSIGFAMTSRYGPDLNGDGVANDPRNSASLANPASFAVTLSGCSNTGSSTYRWTIPGRTPFTTTKCSIVQNLALGTYSVSLRLSDGRVGSRTIVVRDILIVSMGDSAGSGEGNPEVVASGSQAAVWQNRRCHRSSRAGSAKAAKAIEDADTTTSVTFVHVACSGATVPDGVLGPYIGIDPGGATTNLKSQVEQVTDVIGSRSIDAVLLSTGINDAGFGDVATRCIYQADCSVDTTAAPVDFGVGLVLAAAHTGCSVLLVGSADCNEFVDMVSGAVGTKWSGAHLFGQRLPLLPQRYVDVRQRFLAARPTGLATPSAKVFITTYPDMATDEQDRICDALNFPTDWARSMPGFSRTEWAWTRSTARPALNNQVIAGAAAQGWTAVTGVASGFRRHGYCASSGQRWIRRLDESFVRQWDEKGTLHPNGTGHDFIRDRIVTFIEPVLLP